MVHFDRHVFKADVPPSPPAGERILVRAPNWLGDAVMATPFLKRLGKRFPRARIDVLAKPGLAEIFSGAPGVDQVLPIDPRQNRSDLARALRARRYDSAYILPPSFSAAFTCWRAGIPKRIGYAADFRSALLTEAPALDERVHYVRRYLGLLGEMGSDVAPEDFYVPRATRTETEAFLKAKGHEGGEFLAVAPGSRAPARRWFPDRFAGVINGLEAEGISVLLLGAPEDRPFADEVARLSHRPLLNLCGQTSLPLAASLLARSKILLTNESGLMHVGWAVGARIVVVAGPSNPRVTSPFGPRVQVLQRREVPCVPCVRNVCYRRKEEAVLCLRKISEADVLAKIKERLLP